MTALLALPATAVPITLTIDEAVARAIELHPELRAAEQDRIAANANALGAQTALFPTVSISGSYAHAGRRPTISFMGQTMPLGGQDAVELTGYIAQPIFTGGRLSNEIHRARIADDIARLRREALRRSIAASTREACHEMLRAEALHQAAVRAIASAQTHRRDAESRVRAGLSAGIEVIRADARLQAVSLAEVAARNRLASARVRLAVLLRLDGENDLSLRDGLPAIDPEERVPDALAHAVRTRPDLMAARAMLAAERAGVEIAKAAYWPGVSAFYALTWQDDETRRAANHWRIGVAADWEIFNWGRTGRSVRAAAARGRATAERIRVLEDQVRIELREAELAIAAAAEARHLAAARHRVAQEDVRISRLRFTEGVGLGAEVIDAETTLADADAARINAEVDLAGAMNRYRFLAGVEEPRR